MPNENEIKKMKRGELNELAVKLDLNPDEFKRADELRSSIFKRLKTVEKIDKEPKSESRKQKSELKKTAAPKPNPPKTRSERRSRRYREAQKLVDKEKFYPLKEAVGLIGKTSAVKFDAAVELHVNLGVDPKQSDQLVRGTADLPHGSGKKQRVAALVPESDHAAVKKAGADIVGYQDLLDKIGDGKIEFDILVTHPDMMKELSKHAKVLGPRGLMPSPKAGTVTGNVVKVVKELKAGRIEFRVDRYGIIHQNVGRASYKPEHLEENINTLISAITQAKPSSLKNTYLKKLTLTTSMGPGIKVDGNTTDR